VDYYFSYIKRAPLIQKSPSLRIQQKYRKLSKNWIYLVIWFYFNTSLVLGKTGILAARQPKKDMY